MRVLVSPPRLGHLTRRCSSCPLVCLRPGRVDSDWSTAHSSQMDRNCCCCWCCCRWHIAGRWSADVVDLLAGMRRGVVARVASTSTTTTRTTKAAKTNSRRHSHVQLLQLLA